MNETGVSRFAFLTSVFLSLGMVSAALAAASPGVGPPPVVTPPGVLGSIAGTVSSDADGLPLAGTNCSLYRGGSIVATAMTGADGRYVFDKLSAGRYQVGFARVGYASEYYSDAPDLRSAQHILLTPRTRQAADASLASAVDAVWRGDGTCDVSWSAGVAPFVVMVSADPSMSDASTLASTNELTVNFRPQVGVSYYQVRDANGYHSPVVSIFRGIESIFQGRDQYWLRSSDGLLYGYGSGTFGGLGTAGSTYGNVNFPAGSTFVDCGNGGAYWNVGVTRDPAGRQHLWTWGGNGGGYAGDVYGMLGLDPALFPVADPPREVLLPGGFEPLSADAGYMHGVAVARSSGVREVFSWNTASPFSPLRDWAPTQVAALPAGEVPVDVEAGDEYSLVLTESGKVYGFGRNSHGQLGSGSTGWSSVPVEARLPEPVTSISAGSFNAAALTATGRLYVWGFGGRAGFGGGDVLVPQELSFPAPVVQVAMGQVHNLALTADGNVWGWGYSFDGELGTGTRDYAATPVPMNLGPLGSRAVSVIGVADYSSYVATDDGRLYACGRDGGLLLSEQSW